MIILLAGLARSGKDTVGKHLVEKHGYTRFAFADKIKAEYAEYLGVTTEEIEINKEFYRQGLVAWGAAKRDMSPEYWIFEVLKQIRHTDKVVITDCRFENELLTIRKEAERVVCHYIDNPKVQGNGDKSESFDRRWADSVIRNNSTIEDLHKKIDKL